MSDVDAAISALQKAASALRHGDANCLTCLSNLAAALTRTVRADRATRRSRTPAISALRQVVDATSPGQIERSDALLTRFTLTGRTGDLRRCDQRVATGSKRAAPRPSELAQVPVQTLRQRGSLERFERTGQPGDLERRYKRIAAGRGRNEPRPSRNGLRQLSNLEYAQERWYEVHGKHRCISDTAISTLRQAMDAMPGDQPDRAAVLSKHCTRSACPLRRTGQVSDIESAINAFQKAIAATPLATQSTPGPCPESQHCISLSFRAGKT